ncbi:MAG: DUF885 family protein, partial [Pseudomonadota bacterium]
MMRNMTAMAALFALAACDTLPSAPWAKPTAPTGVETIESAEAEPVATETERLNTFFEEAFQDALARSPMTRTFLGIKTDYGKWDDASDAARIREIELQRAMVTEMKETFDFDLLDEQGKLSWRLAEYELEQDERNFAYRWHWYTFTNMRGQHAGIPAFLINQHRVTSKADAEAYVSRLNGITVFLGTHVQNAEVAAEKGILPPKFVFDYTIEASENVLTGYPFGGADYDDASPLMEDFRNKVDRLVSDEVITGEEAAELRTQADLALRNAVEPAYRNLIRVLTEQRESASPDDGAWKLPDGGNYYTARLANMTTTNMTAAEIHELG